jgi:hypothetical protein
MMLFLVVLWWVVGSASFIYWWTSEYDLTLAAAIGSLAAGVCGPITFFIGWRIHGESRPPIILIKARNK